MENTDEATKAGLSTSNVILGLLPTLLAVLSPSIPELALFSAQRPLLAAILSVAAPGVLQTRVFEYEDPSELLDPPEDSGRKVRNQLIVGPWPAWASYLVGVMQWILAFFCGANTIILAIQISNRSVLSWGCTRES